MLVLVVLPELQVPLAMQATAQVLLAALAAQAASAAVAELVDRSPEMVDQVVLAEMVE